MAWLSGPAIAGYAVAGGSLLGGILGGNASKQSAQEIAQADEMASAEQLGMYQQTRADLLPYMTSGNAALSQLDSLMGIKPTTADTPQYTLGPIQDAVNGAAFGTGGGGGGPGESTLNKLQDPYNLFGSSKYGHQEAVDPIGYNLFGSSAFNPGHEINRILGGLAHGGKARGGKTYVVGEKGPEILHMAPGAAGYVEPNSPKADALAYSGRAFMHRMYGGPVGARTGDPIRPAQNISDGYTRPVDPGFGGPAPGIGRTPGMRPGLGPVLRPMPTYPGVPFRPLGGIGFRASGGPVGSYATTPGFASNRGGDIQSPSTPSTGFNPFAGNTTPLSGGQTPNQIMAQSPEYQFVEQQGIQGLDNSAAASGDLLSGGHLKDILNYSQGEASQQYQNIFNNLQAITSLGESAGAMVGNSGTYAGMGMGQSAMAAGNAIGAGAVGAANAYSSSLGNLGFMYAMNPKMFGGSSGG